MYMVALKTNGVDDLIDSCLCTLNLTQLISGTSSAGITALALTSNRRLLAVAEAALTERGCATVNIYDASNLKRRKMLSWPEMGSPTIVCVAFSADGRLCLTQGGAPEWKLVLWTAEKVSGCTLCSHVRVQTVVSSDGDKLQRSGSALRRWGVRLLHAQRPLPRVHRNQSRSVGHRCPRTSGNCV